MKEKKFFEEKFTFSFENPDLYFEFKKRLAMSKESISEYVTNLIFENYYCRENSTDMNYISNALEDIDLRVCCIEEDLHDLTKRKK